MKRLCFNCEKYKEVRSHCLYCGINCCSEPSCLSTFDDEYDFERDLDLCSDGYEENYGCDDCKFRRNLNEQMNKDFGIDKI